MVCISRVCAVGAMLSAALGQPNLGDLANAAGEAAESGAGELAQELLDIDQDDMDDAMDMVEDLMEDYSDFLDPFAGANTTMTIGLEGGKMRVFTGRSGKGMDHRFTLDFGYVQELDADGKAVKGRAVKISKAAMKDDAELVTSEDVVGGAEALVTRLSMPLAFEECSDDRRSSSGKGAKVSATGKGSATGKSGKGSYSNDTDIEDDMDDENDLAFDNDTDERRLMMNETDDGLEGDIEGHFAIEAFVFLEDAAVEYGDEIIEVSRGEFKFNILSSAWPFCGAGHSLSVDMGIHLRGKSHVPKHFGKLVDELLEDRSSGASESGAAVPLSGKTGKKGAKEGDAEGMEENMEDMEDMEDVQETEDMEDVEDVEDSRGKTGKTGGKSGKSGKRGNVLLVDSGDTEVFMDMPTFAIVDGVVSNCSVELDTKGSHLSIEFTFPAFNETLLYDPTGGVNADLSSEDNDQPLPTFPGEEDEDDDLAKTAGEVETTSGGPARSDQFAAESNEDLMASSRSAPGAAGCGLGAAGAAAAAAAIGALAAAAAAV